MLSLDYINVSENKKPIYLLLHYEKSKHTELMKVPTIYFYRISVF